MGSVSSESHFVVNIYYNLSNSHFKMATNHLNNKRIQHYRSNLDIAFDYISKLFELVEEDKQASMLLFKIRGLKQIYPYIE